MLTQLRISDRRLANPDCHEYQPSSRASCMGNYWTQPVYDGEDATTESATRDDWLISGLCAGYSGRDIARWFGISHYQVYKRINELLESKAIEKIRKITGGYTYGRLDAQ